MFQMAIGSSFRQGLDQASGKDWIKLQARIGSIFIFEIIALRDGPKKFDGWQFSL